MELAAQNGQGLPHAGGDKIGQAAVQIAGDHAGLVGGEHLPEGGGGTALQKVRHPLGRGGVVAPGQAEGRLLDLPLEGHSGQGPHAAEVLGAHPHQQGGVAVLAVPGPHAHAVGDHAPLLRGGAGHRAPGAHAEGVHPPAVFQVAGELVVRRAQGRVAGEGPVLGGVDEALGVLDAGPHGKGLGLQGQAQAVQELEHVPGAVAHRQDGLGTLDGLPLAPGLHLQAGELARLGPDARHLSGKAHLAPQGDDLLPDAAHHPGQPVGADVGLGVGEDLFRGAGFDQLLQHLADAGVPGAGGELPVGEGAGAPLAKLHVALRV